MNKFRLISRKGEGTFSEVLEAQHTQSHKRFALKMLKKFYKSIQEVNELKEVKALRGLSDHPNIVKLYDVILDRVSGRVALVLELMEVNLYEAIRNRRYLFPEERVLRWVYQILLALDFMHSRGVFHRDIKPENILLLGDCVKLADLGSAKSCRAKPPFTEYISTRWYRAPECLLTDGHYSSKMDIWAVGCVMFEVLGLAPLFPGDNEIDQVNRIHQVLGCPSQDELREIFGVRLNHRFYLQPFVGSGFRHLLPHASHEALSAIEKLCEYDFRTRPSAGKALKWLLFQDLVSAFMSTLYVTYTLSDHENSRALNFRNTQHTRFPKVSIQPSNSLEVKSQWSYRALPNIGIAQGGPNRPPLTERWRTRVILPPINHI